MKHAETVSELLDVLAQNVRVRRIEQGLSSNELIDKTELSKAVVSSIENGRAKDIKLSSLFKIAKALDCDIRTLLTPLPLDDYADNILELKDCKDSYSEILKSADILSTYYPPLYRSHKIATLLELAVIIPLLDIDELYDACYRIYGDTDNREEYVSELFSRCWARVPDSPGKEYIELLLDHIRSIRTRERTGYMENTANADTKHEAYLAVLEEKRKYLSKLDSISHDNPLFYKKDD